MSGETQVRRRKDKKKKRDSVSDDGSCEEEVKEHGETGGGGGCLAVLVFLLLISGVGILSGLIYIHSTGLQHVEPPAPVVPAAVVQSQPSPDVDTGAAAPDAASQPPQEDAPAEDADAEADDEQDVTAAAGDIDKTSEARETLTGTADASEATAETSAQPEVAAKSPAEAAPASQAPAEAVEEVSDQQRTAYDKADVTADEDWPIRDELDAADALLDKEFEAALHAFNALLAARPRSPRALWGRARALHAQALSERSNSVLERAIAAYQAVLALDGDRPLPLALFRQAAEACVQQMRFRGLSDQATRLQQRLIQKFPDDYMLRNHLATVFMTYGQNSAAQEVLEEVLRLWPDNGYAQVHLGFVHGLAGRYADAARLMQAGLASEEPGVHDSRFYYNLGDAYYRLGETDKAQQTYEEGARRGLLLSAVQRSLYNVDRLTARPYWTAEQTGSADLISALEASWEMIRSEMLTLLTSERPEDGFRPESERLSRHGDWRQFTLFQRGRKDRYACVQVPGTCALIEQFPQAAGCRRGQVKFSLLSAGTRVWPHAGPTNCRLRAHLGLQVPPDGTGITVAGQNRTWQEGKVLIIDDSFEHEVWNDSDQQRFILIVDMWHPELSEDERRQLPAI